MVVSKPKTRFRGCYNGKTINVMTGYPHRDGENKKLSPELMKMSEARQIASLLLMMSV
jgi:hypothetical protein